MIGVDRDQAAIAQGAALVGEAGGRLELVEDRFSNLAAIAGSGVADGVVFDLGVSSMQLDEAARGFSFRLDGPLDMRMGRDGPSAADIVARAGERDLAAIIAALGEEHHARAVARAIVKARARASHRDNEGACRDRCARGARARWRHPSGHPHVSGLADFRQRRTRRIGARPCRRRTRIEAVGPPRRGRLPLARRSHRQNLPRRAQPHAGRLAPPARSSSAPPPTFRVLTRRPETPDEAEIAANPRARSAKLRAAERTDAPPRTAAIENLLPRLPSLADIMAGRP